MTRGTLLQFQRQTACHEHHSVCGSRNVLIAPAKKVAIETGHGIVRNYSHPHFVRDEYHGAGQLGTGRDQFSAPLFHVLLGDGPIFVKGPEQDIVYPKGQAIHKNDVEVPGITEHAGKLDLFFYCMPARGLTFHFMCSHASREFSVHDRARGHEHPKAAQSLGDLKSISALSAPRSPGDESDLSHVSLPCCRSHGGGSQAAVPPIAHGFPPIRGVIHRRHFTRRTRTRAR